MIILYARYIGTYGFITKEYTLYNSDLPSEFDGLKIIHFSDIHYNRAITSSKVDKIIEEINLISQHIDEIEGTLNELIEADTPKTIV